MSAAIELQRRARISAALITYADRASALAQRLRTLDERLQTSINATNWTGKRAQRFYNDAERAQHDLAAWASTLEGLASDLREAAARIL